MSDTLAEPAEEMAFLDLHKKFIEANKPNSALLPLHEAALGRFEMLGFPHSKHEMYTFVNTKNLIATPFATSNTSISIPKEVIVSHIFSGCENSCLVFVNGVLALGCRHLQLVVVTMCYPYVFICVCLLVCLRFCLVKPQGHTTAGNL